MHIINMSMARYCLLETMFKHKILEDERGVSVILGAALMIGILIAFVSAFLVIWIPGQVGQREHTQMKGVEDSFRQLRNTIANIQAGEFRSVDINMSANYSIPLVPNSKQVGTLSVTPAQVQTVRIPPSDDAYIDNNSGNTNYGSNENLRVENWSSDSKISFLKFSLDNGSIPRAAAIVTANLWLYCNDNKSTPRVQCRVVDNDNWKESTITWNNARENIRDILDNESVGGTGWFSWTIKDFVTVKVTGDNRLLTLGLIAVRGDNDNNQNYANFYSKDSTKDNGIYRPYLEVKYTSGPPIWDQTDWSGENTYPTKSVPENDAWSDIYNKYYTGENENVKTPGEIRLENAISNSYSWTQDSKADFDSDNLVNLDTSSFPGSVVLAGDNVTIGNTTNNAAQQPYAAYTYVQRLDPSGQYATPSNGVIIQWRWYPRATTNGAKLKIFRYVSGSVWTVVGESGPVNLSSGMNTFYSYIPVKTGDRIGMYSGSSRTYYSDTSGYSVSRNPGDAPIYSTSSFTDHTESRRIPIDAILKIYKYSGTLTSIVYDTQGPLTNWRTISWGENLPPDTNITLQTRTGDNLIPDNTWTAWSNPYTNPAGMQITSLRARYIQYRVNFSTNDTSHTPFLDNVKITFITSGLYKPAGYVESSVYNAGTTVDWRNITWDAETPTLLGENKPVNNEPNPTVDWSPLIGENQSPLQNALTQDNIYEDIAENLRSPWWNRSWACRNPVTINNLNNPNSLENYQVKIEVNYDNNMFPNFDDLRFVDNDNLTQLSYWIENYNSGVNATVWVRVPKIPANGSKVIYMYYGNPGASQGSDFSATFPNALIIDGTSKTLGGIQKYDWVNIKNSGTLVAQSENALQLFARKIVVDSTSFIYAIGSGYAGGPTNRLYGRQENGWSYNGRPGTSGGTGGYALGSSQGPGGGGGAYGGIGGNGGGAQGTEDYPGVGGSIFGSDNDNSVYMGSGGGSGGLGSVSGSAWDAGGAGGAGGGVVRLNAGIINISGTIFADGGAGASGMCQYSSYGTGGGGGGSGGTILIEGNKITITGKLSAKGGTGGARSPTSSYGGAGGGGGGGRIKIFYDNSLDNASATETVAGGASGGASYAAPVAQPGTIGSIYAGKISYPEPTTSVGAKELESANRGQQGYYLNWEHRINGVSPGYDNYTLHIWGYSDGDQENIGVYIWMSKTNSWSFIDNLPKVPETQITFSIQPKNLDDYVISDNISIGYFDSAGDPTRTIIHIDYISLECTGNFTTSVKVETRTGNTANPYTDNTWSGWQEADNNGPVQSPNATQYIQYRIKENTQNGKISPVFKEITITYRLFSEYGTVGFSSGNVFYPDQAYMYEGSTVFLSQSNVNLTVLDPMMIRWENADNNRIKLYANFWIIENSAATLTSTGTRTIRVYCLNNTQTVIPAENLPNRDNVIIRALSPYTDVWSAYLSSQRQMLNAMGINASFNPNTLTLTIGGRDNRPGVKDIYYYENVKELEVDLI